MMLTCRQVGELASSYAEGELGFAERVKLRFHLAICPPCMTYLKQVRLTKLVLEDLPKAPLDERTQAELVDVYRLWLAGAADDAAWQAESPGE